MLTLIREQYIVKVRIKFARKECDSMTDTLALEMAIRKKGITKKQVAIHLGLSEQGFLLKLTNKNEFKASEIDKLVSLLKLEDNSIFFKKNAN